MNTKAKIEYLIKHFKLQVVVGLILYLVSIITIIFFFHVQSAPRYFNVFAILILAYLGLYFLPRRLIRFFVRNKQEKNARYQLSKLFLLLVLISIPIITLLVYSSYSKKLLSKSSLYSKAIVQNIKWVSTRSGGEYRVFYFYSIDDKVYYHNAKNVFWKVGDTILVRYCASNPDNHEIIMK